MQRVGPVRIDLQSVCATYALAPGLEWHAGMMGVSLGIPTGVLVEAHLYPGLPRDDWLARNGTYALHTRRLFPSLLDAIETLINDEHRRLINYKRHRRNQDSQAVPRRAGFWENYHPEGALPDVKLMAEHATPEDWYALDRVLQRVAHELFTQEPTHLTRIPNEMDEPAHASTNNRILNLYRQRRERRKELYRQAMNSA